MTVKSGLVYKDKTVHDVDLQFRLDHDTLQLADSLTKRDVREETISHFAH